MKYITSGISLAFLALLLYIAWNVYSQYRKAQGTTWERLLAASRNSSTILWQKFVIVVAGVVANLDPLAEWIGGPKFENFLNTYIGDPKILAAALLFVSLVSIRARMRSL